MSGPSYETQMQAPPVKVTLDKLIAQKNKGQTKAKRSPTPKKASAKIPSTQVKARAKGKASKQIGQSSDSPKMPIFDTFEEAKSARPNVLHGHLTKDVDMI